LHFEIPAVVEESAQFTNDSAPLHKHVTNFSVNDEIDISLPVSNLDVFQAMPLLRQRQKTLREKHQLCRQHGQFAGACAKQIALNSNEIADVEEFVQLEVPLGKLILFRVHLQLAFAIRKRDEAGLSE